MQLPIYIYIHALFIQLFFYLMAKFVQYFWKLVNYYTTTTFITLVF